MQLIAPTLNDEAIGVLLHGSGEGGIAGRIIAMWVWEPSVVAGCAALLFAYAWAQGFRFSWRWTAFAGGVLVLLLALVSPLHPLGERYLFSAHMVQHLLLMLVVPPLLLAGMPAQLLRRALACAWPGRAERVLGSPPVAWGIFALTMWAWHAPALFNATLDNEYLHTVEHVMFLAAGTIFWWPVLDPLPERQRLSAPAAMFYLFLAAASSSVLGIILTFAPPGLYPAYLNPADTYGILSQIRAWGLSPAADQQLAGMVMWVPGCVAYVLAALAVLARWFASPDEDEGVQQAAASRGATIPMRAEDA